MQQRALWRSTIREISYSLPRFISILLMITLGAFVFVGLLTIGPTMEKTLYSYLDEHHMADLTIRHPLGLDERDQRIIEGLDGVQRISYSYQVDQLVEESGDVLALESLADFPVYDVRAGRLPQKPQEIALSDHLQDRYHLGQTLHLSNGLKEMDDQLTLDTFVVSGFLTSPEYLNPDALVQPTALGDGSLSGFAVLLPEVFTAEYPTLSRVDFVDTLSLPSNTRAYRQAMKRHVRHIETAFSQRPDRRLDSLLQDARDQLERGEISLEDAQRQLEDGQIALRQAQEQLARGRNDLAEGQRKLSAGIALGAREIQDAGHSLSESRRSLSAGEQSLFQGEASLEEGRRSLATNRITLQKARAQYENAKATLAASKQEFEIGQEVLRKSGRELEAAKAALAQGEAQYNQGVNELAANRAKIDQGRATSESSRVQLETGREQLAAGREQLNSSKVQLDAQKTLLDQQSGQIASLRKAYISAVEAGDAVATALLGAQLQEAQTKYNSAFALWQINQNAWEANQAALNAKSAELDQGAATLRTSLLEIQSGEQALIEGQEILNASRLELERSRRKVQEGQRAYDSGLRDAEAGRLELQQAEHTLQQAKRELDQGAAALDLGEQRVESNRAELQAARQKLDMGKKEWQNGYDQLQQARRQLDWKEAQGRKELEGALEDILAGEAAYYQSTADYFAAYPEAQGDIRAARETLDDHREDLQRLIMPEYTIQDRAQDPHVSEYAASARGIDLLGRIFPIFFYLIALLVSLTTMTRMVEDDRSQIGTLKGLGYDSLSIMRKYIVYSAIAAILGTVLGILLGYKVLMPVIWDAYSVGYIFPTYKPVMSPWVIFATFFVDLACTTLAALLAVGRNLQLNVASLLRPKAPAQGTRILLERVRPLWRRLSFNQKITFRNLFRYKRRMSMTIIGVAGCMGLITMGLGLNYAIQGPFDRQFVELNQYDAIAIFDSNASDASIAEFQRTMRSGPSIAADSAVRYDNGIFPVDNASDQALTVVTPEDPAQFNRQVILKDARTGADLDLAEGPVITQKTARILGLSSGDAFSYKDDFGQWHRITIQGICENYIGHSIYLHPKDYQDLSGKSLVPNAHYISLVDPAQVDAFTEITLRNRIAQGVLKTTTSSNFIEKLSDSLGVVVNVIILASMLLALVVLYNLTNINVEERLRELSTIKVLGFYPREVTAYIYRETFALTFLGILLGAGLGKIIHTTICRALAPPIFMMMEVVLPRDYLLAAMFTFLTSLLVMFIMHRKMQRVDMIEALKGTE